MDISSLTGLYTSYIQSNATDATSKAAQELSQNKDYSTSTDEELMSACKQFEAYFLEQCFKEMLKTVKTDEYSSSSTSTLVDYYKDEMVKNVAEESTENQGLGLAQMLYEQMKRNYNL